MGAIKLDAVDVMTEIPILKYNQNGSSIIQSLMQRIQRHWRAIVIHGENHHKVIHSSVFLVSSWLIVFLFISYLFHWFYNALSVIIYPFS